MWRLGQKTFKPQPPGSGARSPQGRRRRRRGATVWGWQQVTRQPPWHDMLCAGACFCSICARVAWRGAAGPWTAVNPAIGSVCSDGDTCFQWGFFQAFPAGTTLRLRGATALGFPQPAPLAGLLLQYKPLSTFVNTQKLLAGAATELAVSLFQLSTALALMLLGRKHPSYPLAAFPCNPGQNSCSRVTGPVGLDWIRLIRSSAR